MNQSNPLQEKITLEKTKLAAELQQHQLQHAHKSMALGLTKESINIDRTKLMADMQMAGYVLKLEITESQNFLRFKIHWNYSLIYRIQKT